MWIVEYVFMVTRLIIDVCEYYKEQSIDFLDWFQKI